MGSLSPNSWWLVLAAPVISAILVVVLVAPARHFGLLDHPGGRKQHAAPTPLLGGLAIFLTYLVTQFLGGSFPPAASWSLFGAMLVTVAIGLADDANEIGHRSKFVAQLIAALVVVSGTSVHVTAFGDLLGFGDLLLGKWSYLVTVLAIIGLMNAVNMIDGVDGLAGTVVLVPLVLLAGVALAAGDGAMGFEILLLAGAICGFLFFNLRSPWRPRALVFLGDTGGMLLGLLIAWYSVKLAGAPGYLINPITAVWVLAVPLLDMGSVMLLRMSRRQSPFNADRRHLHHVLLDAGYSAGQVVAVMSGFSLFYGLLGIQAERAGVPEFVMFFVFLGLWASYFFALARPQAIRVIAHRIVAPCGSAASSG